MNKYKNLWHKSTNIPRPEFYENEAPKIGEYRGVSVFKLFTHGFDFVINGACITQRAGASDYQNTINEVLDGKAPVADTVADHLKACGFTPLLYSEAN